MCCDMLGVVGSSLKMVKFGPTTPYTSQHVATGWPNARNMLRPTVLRYVELACCDRLAAVLGVSGSQGIRVSRESGCQEYQGFRVSGVSQESGVSRVSGYLGFQGILGIRSIIEIKGIRV